MGSAEAVSFLVAVSDAELRKRLVSLLSKRGTVIEATSLAELRHVLERHRTIEVLIASRPLPDGDPLAIVRRFTRTKRLVDVPAAVIVPEISECEASVIAEIERAYAYVLDPSLIDDTLVPALADRWQADYAAFRRKLYEKDECAVQKRMAEWRRRFDLTDFQCALLHAAAGGAGSLESVQRSHVLAANAERAVADLLVRTGLPTYRDVIERFVEDVLGEPKTLIGEIPMSSSEEKNPRRGARRRSGSARPPRS